MTMSKRELGWQHKAAFKEFIEMMVAADLARQGTEVYKETVHLSPHRWQ